MPEGSTPLPSSLAALAQLAEAPGLEPGGSGFESQGRYHRHATPAPFEKIRICSSFSQAPDGTCSQSDRLPAIPTPGSDRTGRSDPAGRHKGLPKTRQAKSPPLGLSPSRGECRPPGRLASSPSPLPPAGEEKKTDLAFTRALTRASPERAPLGAKRTARSSEAFVPTTRIRATCAVGSENEHRREAIQIRGAPPTATRAKADRTSSSPRLRETRSKPASIETLNTGGCARQLETAARRRESDGCWPR